MMSDIFDSQLINELEFELVLVLELVIDERIQVKSLGRIPSKVQQMAQVGSEDIQIQQGGEMNVQHGGYRNRRLRTGAEHNNCKMLVRPGSNGRGSSRTNG
ncbi:MAG: hypothetical protein EZS28_051459 [Streblomastix strix]|uniref:Uncharacterized protein n=1 Tax=Streblomastix strix TaxID=222440 RepID=A0A5J4T3U2_9EUKA|nr:MAG: hypothetical protein EZS28_051459 [Streblomastix strix]